MKLLLHATSLLLLSAVGALLVQGPLTWSLGALRLGPHTLHFDGRFDELSALAGTTLQLLYYAVFQFSRRYLAGDPGRAHFFRNAGLFYLGGWVLLTAGTLELFFAGWELLGLASFLLIAYAPHRTRVARSALSVFLTYRLCDVGLLMSSILTHHLATTSSALPLAIDLAALPASWSTLLTLLLLLAIVGKSAQFPFLHWPARAMEGPTVSSSLFYGGLALHAGTVLVYRTLPTVQSSALFTGLLLAVALVSCVLAMLMALLSPHRKSQIVYGAVAHVSLLLAELALGLTTLYLAHLCLHMLWRTRQFLFANSRLEEWLREAAGQRLLKKKLWDRLPAGARRALFTLVVSEFGLSPSLRSGLLQRLFRWKLRLRRRTLVLALTISGLSLASLLGFGMAALKLKYPLAHLFAAADLVLCGLCVIETRSAQTNWKRFGAAQLLFVAAMLTYDIRHPEAILVYAAVALPLWALADRALAAVAHGPLYSFAGQRWQHPRAYRIFLVCFIGLAAYPLTPLFWAEDMLFSDLLERAPSLLILCTLSLLLNGIVVGRTLVKVFWGPKRWQRA